MAERLSGKQLGRSLARTRVFSGAGVLRPVELSFKKCVFNICLPDGEV